jgi:hypothetical protein
MYFRKKLNWNGQHSEVLLLFFSNLKQVYHIYVVLFNTADGWNTAIQSKVPVRAVVTGNVWEVNANNVRAARPINHTYEFAEYRTQFSDLTNLADVFEVCCR